MIVFLHGLESSSQGTKARWFKERFPEMLIPDFSGRLEERMQDLKSNLEGRDNLILIGSSFGGLMATLFTLENVDRVKRVVLLAPALNFPGFHHADKRKIVVQCHLYIGIHDVDGTSDYRLGYY